MWFYRNILTEALNLKVKEEYEHEKFNHQSYKNLSQFTLINFCF